MNVEYNVKYYEYMNAKYIAIIYNFYETQKILFCVTISFYLLIKQEFFRGFVKIYTVCPFFTV